MLRHRHIAGCLLVTFCSASLAAPPDARPPGTLFPPIENFTSGTLKVSDLHTMTYALSGNPKGKPVFVLHGGPGFGCYPRLAQYFDPGKFHIILHDQRGAGRSLPPGELRENTTQDLVADIERLREHLEIDGKILIFGGSWGSALALAYAEAHPQRVSGMVLRGIFTGDEDQLHGFGGPAPRMLFPDAVADLEAALPRGFDFEPPALLKLFTEGDPATARRVSKAWIRFAIKIGRLHASPEMVERGFGDWDPLPAMKIDCHYASNGFFLEEGQLLRDADKLRDIPVTIINGRYDTVCPPVTAWRLHRRLPNSKLVIVEEAGHSEGEEGTTRALIEAVAQFE